jgi:hypothetical protein
MLWTQGQARVSQQGAESLLLNAGVQVHSVACQQKHIQTFLSPDPTFEGLAATYFHIPILLLAQPKQVPGLTPHERHTTCLDVRLPLPSRMRLDQTTDKTIAGP